MLDRPLGYVIFRSARAVLSLALGESVVLSLGSASAWLYIWKTRRSCKYSSRHEKRDREAIGSVLKVMDEP